MLLSLHSAHHLHRVGGGNHLHHLAGFLELLEQSVHLLDCGATTFGDALATAAGDDFGMLALVWGHRIDDSLNALEGIVVDIDIFQRLAHTGNHRGEVLEVTHLLDIGNLLEEVVEIELVFCDALREALSLLGVVLLLHTVNEGDDITHAEDTVCHTCGAEGVDSLEFLAGTHKFDRLGNDSAN